MGSLVALWLAASSSDDVVLLGRSGRFPSDSPVAQLQVLMSNS